VAVCGEMAGDPTGAQLLVGLGVHELSMGPGSFGSVKRAVAARSHEDLRSLAQRAMTLGSAAEVRALVGEA
jgi:phosphoenolpyruvate-protein kinase (PTS system EI component)